MKKILLLLFLFINLSTKAQQDPQFTQYMFNSFYYNPAVAGTENRAVFAGVARFQWIGYSPTISADGGAPSTQMVSMHTRLPTQPFGVGAVILRDVLGPQTNFMAQVAFAYHKQMGKYTMSAGFRSGLYQQTIDFNRYRAADPNDPLIPSNRGVVSQMQPDINFGLQIRSEKWYAGVSATHLNKPTFDMGLSQKTTLNPHLYFTGGYFYDVSFDLRLQFVSLIETDLNNYTFDLGGLAYFKDTMWGGLSFRQSEAMILILGYSLLPDKSLKVGYSLDYIIKDQAAKQPTSHEFMVTYTLPVDLSGKKPQRTPRFRY